MYLSTSATVSEVVQNKAGTTWWIFNTKNPLCMVFNRYFWKPSQLLSNHWTLAQFFLPCFYNRQRWKRIFLGRVGRLLLLHLLILILLTSWHMNMSRNDNSSFVQCWKNTCSSLLQYPISSLSSSLSSDHVTVKSPITKYPWCIVNCSWSEEWWVPQRTQVGLGVFMCTHGLYAKATYSRHW